LSLLVPLGLLALLALPAILLLYFLKVRRPEVRVATLMFWRPFVADRQANAPRRGARRARTIAQAPNRGQSPEPGRGTSAARSSDSHPDRK